MDSSRWRSMPYDIVREQLNYFKTPEEVRKFCKSDPRIYEIYCRDENNEFWKNLYRRNFSDIIALKNGETVMSKYIENKNILDRLDEMQKFTLGIREGYEKIVQLFDLNQLSQKQLDEALFWPAGLGHLNIIKYLKEHGANIHIDHDWALVLATNHGHLPVVAYLVENGADINYFYNNLLALAVKFNYFPIVVYLIEKGADIHANNELPLRNAIHFNNLPIVKILVDNGADIHVNNELPLRLAASLKHYDIIEFLIDNGADIYLALNTGDGLIDPDTVIPTLEEYL